MIRLPGIAVPLSADTAEYTRIAARLLRVRAEAILRCRLARHSIDARRKDDVHAVVTLDVSVSGDEAALLARCDHKDASIAPVSRPFQVARLERKPRHRPIVVGSGPAGLFAGLTLAMAGAEPIVLERGQDVRTRKRDVEAFFQGGALQPSSNVQFGEGGAGTFSDGKLNTGTKDPRGRAVLETFVACGAPEEILYRAKPHIGTDRLPGVVASLRERIISLGGEVRFASRLSGLLIKDGALRGVRIGDQSIEAECLILAIGHSAFDTFEMLLMSGVQMLQKPFSIGVRIEHPQALINRAQYGRFAEALPAAEYKLSAHLKNGRGVYTFCMCPGGEVVAAATEADGVVTNGMSSFARSMPNANSGLLVDVRPEDFGDSGPLSGFSFRAAWERRAYQTGGGEHVAPAQRVEDFLKGCASTSLDGDVPPSYRPRVSPADLRACLPAFVADSIAEGLARFDRQLSGFSMPSAVLTGVETRSSCPVRIPRDETGQANIRGLYPAGEGAGYAGGILSAAVDGIRAAEQALMRMSNAFMEEF